MAAPAEDRRAPAELVPLHQYRAQVLARLGPLEPLELALLEALGCVLAEDVVADTAIPRFASSAMDGYAVIARSIEPGTPMRVVDEGAAGSPSETAVTADGVVRIMTGAPVPDGTDTIIPVEQTSEAGGRVVFHTEPEAGRHIRPAGQDVAEGAVVVSTGRRLQPADLGMLASVGRSAVRVHPRPRVVVLSTGDELVEPGSPLQPGQLYDANSYALTAAIREAGATAYRRPIVPDDPQQLIEAFEGALLHADVIVTTGGVSAGRYDHVKDVMAQLGDVTTQRVGMQPGMPQSFGFLGDGQHRVPTFGLPGNPVSAYVSFEIFVRPALRRMQGRTDENRPRVTATLDEDVVSPADKVSFLRVELARDERGGWHARTTGPQGSGLLHSVVAAHGLAEVPADRTELAAGQEVIVHLLVDS